MNTVPLYSFPAWIEAPVAPSSLWHIYVPDLGSGPHAGGNSWFVEDVNSMAVLKNAVSTLEYELTRRDAAGEAIPTASDPSALEVPSSWQPIPGGITGMIVTDERVRAMMLWRPQHPGRQP